MSNGDSSLKDQWFKKHKNHKILCEIRSFYEECYLINWDSYSILLEKHDNSELLIIQAPGMIFECIDCNKKIMEQMMLEHFFGMDIDGSTDDPLC